MSLLADIMAGTTEMEHIFASKLLKAARFRQFLTEIALPGFAAHNKLEQARKLLESRNDFSARLFPLHELLTLKGADVWDYQTVGHNFERDRAFNAISALTCLVKDGSVTGAMWSVLLTRYVPETPLLARAYACYTAEDFDQSSDFELMATAAKLLYAWFLDEDFTASAA